MATAVAKFGSIALQKISRIPTPRSLRHSPCASQYPASNRKFHSSPISRKAKESEADDEDNSENDVIKPYSFTIEELDSEERAQYEALSPKEKKVYEDERKMIYDHFTSPKVSSALQGDISRLVARTQADAPHIEIERTRSKPGFWNMGETDYEGAGEDDPYKGDDLTEFGHAELDQHKEVRHYARIAAWEMPLLNQIATPFQPPDNEHVLRFRYTTYMGESHPAQKKIVLEFATRDLPSLTEAQRIKLIKLVGPRYNPETDVVKMSSEMFETQAQNKRYLGDLVDILIAEAKDEKDMFEDVPLDFRHHRFKKKAEFPDSWKLDARKLKQLEANRVKVVEAEKDRIVRGLQVDGAQIVQEAMKALPAQNTNRVLLDAQQGRKGKGRPMLR